MENNKYVSSIVIKYGDTDKVSLDSARLFEILDRQGSSLLIDVIAEHAGRGANKFKLSDEDRTTLLNSLVNELREALSERL